MMMMMMINLCQPHLRLHILTHCDDGLWAGLEECWHHELTLAETWSPTTRGLAGTRTQAPAASPSGQSAARSGPPSCWQWRRSAELRSDVEETWLLAGHQLYLCLKEEETRTDSHLGDLWSRDLWWSEITNNFMALRVCLIRILMLLRWFPKVTDIKPSFRLSLNTWDQKLTDCFQGNPGPRRFTSSWNVTSESRASRYILHSLDLRLELFKPCHRC